MQTASSHLRNTFLAGIFAATPLAITAFVIWYVEHLTRQPVRALFGVNIPFLGVLIAIGLIYALGLAVSSIIGRLLLKFVDHVLLRVPMLKAVYQGWKQVVLTPGGTEGIFSRVALVTVENEAAPMLAFTSGRPVEGIEEVICVFVPNVPNAVTGRLYFVRRDRCRVLEMTTEEAFKVILSTGNYVPTEIGAAALSLASK
jgi:uncharacterized membrane protein